MIQASHRLYVAWVWCRFLLPIEVGHQTRMARLRLLMALNRLVTILLLGPRRAARIRRVAAWLAVVAPGGNDAILDQASREPVDRQ